jgi:hypothetical protein
VRVADGEVKEMQKPPRKPTRRPQHRRQCFLAPDLTSAAEWLRNAFLLGGDEHDNDRGGRNRDHGHDDRVDPG